MELKTELLFEMKVVVGDTQDMGATPHGNRRIAAVTGGTFLGPKLRGEILPGGGDWLCVRPDGATELDVRITLCTDDGHFIYSSYRGIVYASPEVKERIKNGKVVDPAEIYFRTTPAFETGSEKYGWINRIVAVGAGKRTKTGIEYSVFEVL